MASKLTVCCQAQPKLQPQILVKLINKHFPPGNSLHPIINRQTVKIGYKCLPNMGAHVSKHNNKILRNSFGKKSAPPPPKCNCIQSKVHECPLPGACKQEGVIYQATVQNSKGNKETYVGLASKFKSRFYKHKASLETYSSENSTTLSTHFWEEKNNVSWKILERNIPTYNPVVQKCNLCLREKFNIIFNPQLCSLNSRQEVFSHCRHIKTKLLWKEPD